MTWKEFRIEEIKRICAANNLSDNLCEEAISKYKLSKKEERRHGVALACVFLSCKKNRLDKSLEDIESNAFPLDPKINPEVFKTNKDQRIKKAKELLNKLEI
jgi:transcription initiation factor TFIIIB Brf1 subunit/transcription initiation factor TFIIB